MALRLATSHGYVGRISPLYVSRLGMRNITRRQLLITTGLGGVGVALLGVSGCQPKQCSLQRQRLAAVEAISAATQQLFNSVNVVVPQNLVKRNG